VSATPSAYEKRLSGQVIQQQQDSLWQAGNDGQVRGDQSSIRRSGYTAAIVHPFAAALLVGFAGVGLALATWNKLKG